MQHRLGFGGLSGLLVDARQRTAQFDRSRMIEQCLRQGCLRGAQVAAHELRLRGRQPVLRVVHCTQGSEPNKGKPSDARSGSSNAP